MAFVVWDRLYTRLKSDFWSTLGNPDDDPVNATEEQPRREVVTGLWILGVFVLGGLGVAALVPLDAGAYAEGVVAVSGNRQAVQHRDGGIVSGIAVTEGQAVEKGDILLTISSPELIAAERAAAGETIFLLAMRERLRAGNPLPPNNPFCASAWYSMANRSMAIGIR